MGNQPAELGFQIGTLDQTRRERLDGLEVVAVTGLFQGLERHAQLRPGHEAFVRPHDAPVFGARDILADQQFLVQFLAGPEPDELNVDIALGLEFGFQPVPLDERHAGGEIHDLDGLPHVQQKDIAAAAQARRLQHELGRFLNGHEVAGDIRMGHRDRAAVLDLFQEQRHDRTRRPEHVAEADDGEAGVRRGFLQRLQDHLREALAGAHGAGGAHRLVGRDQDEVLNAAASAPSAV